MATIIFSGTTTANGFNMSVWNAGFILQLLANETNVSAPSAAQVRYQSGSTLLVGNGTFGGFDAFGDPTTGTVTSFTYTATLFGGVPQQISVGGLSIAVPTLNSWVATNNTAALQAALFDGADTVTGGASGETIFSYGGDDNVDGGAGNDVLRGGDGNDTLSGGAGADRIEGGPGLDILNGGDGDDFFSNDAGPANTGVDAIDGGAGNDLAVIARTGSVGLTLSVAEMATSTGVTLADGTSIRNVESVQFYAGNGDDTLILSVPGVFGSYFSGAGGNDTLIADFSTRTEGFNLNPGNPSLIGIFAGYSLESIERFLVSTGSGSDLLIGGVGDDVLSSGAGDDGITAGAGNDILRGGAGVDDLNGGDGDDVLEDASGLNSYNGGAGTDFATVSLTGRSGPLSYTVGNASILENGSTLISFASIERVSIVGGFGADAFTGGALDDVLDGGVGDDTLAGGDGNDVLSDASGVNSYDGGAGTDTAIISLSARTGALSYVVGDASVLENGIGLVSVTNIERVSITGGSGADTFTGGALNDTLDGGAGIDAMAGGLGDDTYGVDTFQDIVTEAVGAGSDTVRTTLTNVGVFDFANIENLTYTGSSAFVGQGDSNANTITGGSANDYVYAYGGDDTARGNAGVDVFIMADGADTVFGGDGQDYMFGEGGNDTLNGEAGVDVFLGGDGADTMFGGDEGDYFYGEIGDDVAFGENGNDIFVMTAGNDTATGGAGQDYFYMGDGADTLNGGDGVDVMLGEAGDDTFNPGLGVDYVFMGSGTDRLNVDRALSGVTVLNDFTAGAASGDVINLTGTGWTSFTQVQQAISDFTVSGGFCILTLDADTSIWFIGVAPNQLTAGDFLLGSG